MSVWYADIAGRMTVYGPTLFAWELFFKNLLTFDLC